MLRYRGRAVTDADLTFIRELIGKHPGASRRALSKKLCEAWGWVQPNGELRDMVCRGLMLALHRGGHIELPPVRCQPPNNVIRSGEPRSVLIETTPIVTRLDELQPLAIRQVRRGADEKLLDGLIGQHHYLGYTRPVGEHLKYLVAARDGRPVAAMTWGSAVRDMRPRDRFIGWSLAARRANLRYLAYNARYLILPWVRVQHLASHLLGRIGRRISADWNALYGHPIYYLESFVYPARYRGTCYRAANWVFLGQTSGRGKNNRTRRQRIPKKEVLGYPLCKDFRQRLGRIG